MKQSKLVTIAVGLTFYNSFVLFEELIIDRFGYSQYLPCYVVGQFCEWDAAAILLIGGGLFLWYRKRAKLVD